MKKASSWQELLKLAGSQQVRYIKQVKVDGQEYPAYQSYDMTGELIVYAHQ